VSYETGDGLEKLPILKLSRHRERHYNVVVNKKEKNRGHIGNHSKVKNILVLNMYFQDLKKKERDLFVLG
jgi:ribosome maturation protein Sdo1